LKQFAQYPLLKYISHPYREKQTSNNVDALTLIRFEGKDNYSIVDKLIHEHNYYPDGTPKRGHNSRSKTHPDEEQHHLVEAVLDQYNEDNNLFGVCPPSFSPSLPPSDPSLTSPSCKCLNFFFFYFFHINFAKIYDSPKKFRKASWGTAAGGAVL
jgi:hypothetical protein